MDELHKLMDLDLWSNEELIRRQNVLKSQFIFVLKEVGNSFSAQEFRDISSRAISSKISRGNDLNGLPYQVLDLIRDFDSLEGVNIRLLNWFGVGFFTIVLHGKNRENTIPEHLEQDFSFCLSRDQWDYKDVILNGNQTDSTSKILGADLDFHQWIKKIEITRDPDANAGILLKEVKNILGILRLRGQRNRN